MSVNNTRGAIYWSSIDQILVQGLMFIVSVMLARLLVPEDFGTIAVLSLFLAIASLFVNAGFSTALIQKQDISHIDESTVFWFNIGVGLVVTIVLIAFAPWLADFFNSPVLKILTIFMASTVLISAFSSVQRTLLSKRLDFKTLMKIRTISTLLSGVIGVYLAWTNYGVWALVAQALSRTISITMLSWFYSAWRPLMIFSKSSLSRMFEFSGYIFAAGLLAAIHQHGSALLIGKLFGVRELGFYNRANSTQLLAAQIPTGIVSRITFPLFSSLNTNAVRLRRLVQKSIRSIMLITSPLLLGLAILAEPVIQIIYGDQWIPSVPILQVLCLAGLLVPIHHINVSVLNAQGHANINFRISIFKRLTGITLLVIGSFFGVIGIAWASVIQSIVCLIINGHYTKIFLDYGIVEQVKDCLPSLILSLIMIILVALSNNSINIGGIVELLILVLVGALFYLLSNIIFGIIAFKEALEFIRGK